MRDETLIIIILFSWFDAAEWAHSLATFTKECIHLWRLCSLPWATPVLGVYWCQSGGSTFFSYSLNWRYLSLPPTPTLFYSIWLLVLCRAQYSVSWCILFSAMLVCQGNVRHWQAAGNFIGISRTRLTTVMVQGHRIAWAVKKLPVQNHNYPTTTLSLFYTLMYHT